MSMFTKNGQPFDGDPRHALTQVLTRYEDRGWRVVAATELEFFITGDTDPSPLGEAFGARRRYSGITEP